MLRKMLVCALFALFLTTGLGACGRFYDLPPGTSPGIGLDPATWVAPHWPADTSGYYVFEEIRCEFWEGPCQYLQRYGDNPRDYNTRFFQVRVDRESKTTVYLVVASGMGYTLDKRRPYIKKTECFPQYNEALGNFVMCTPRFASQ